MIDLRITFQADELLYREHKKMSLILKLMFLKFLRQFKTKTRLAPSQILSTPCCQGNVSAL